MPTRNKESSSGSTRQILEEYLRGALGTDEPIELDKAQVKQFLHFLCMRMGIENTWTSSYGDYLTEDALNVVFPGGHTESSVIKGEDLAKLLDYMQMKPLLEARHPKKCVVLGGGAYGTAITQVLSTKGHRVTIVFQDSETELAKSVALKHVNPSCFPDKVLNPFLVTAVTEKDMAGPLAEADFVVVAIPVQFTFAYLTKHKALIPPTTPVVTVSKGIDGATDKFLSEIIPQALDASQPLAYLAGPSFAYEMMEAAPTCVTVAAADPLLARSVQVLFSSQVFRVFTTTDVMGVEVGSALKNVLAIATGVMKGLGFGPNTQMALVTRGWADIRVLSKCYGAREETMTGLAGIGDVMLTCFGGLSRNARFGQRLAETGSVQKALDQAGGTVEGLPTAKCIKRIARMKNLRLPVLEAISDMLEDKLPPKAMIMHVMTLPLGPEEGASSKL